MVYILLDSYHTSTTEFPEQQILSRKTDRKSSKNVMNGEPIQSILCGFLENVKLRPVLLGVSPGESMGNLLTK